MLSTVLAVRTITRDRPRLRIKLSMMHPQLPYLVVRITTRRPVSVLIEDDVFRYRAGRERKEAGGHAVREYWQAEFRADDLPAEVERGQRIERVHHLDDMARIGLPVRYAAVGADGRRYKKRVPRSVRRYVAERQEFIARAEAADEAADD